MLIRPCRLEAQMIETMHRSSIQMYQELLKDARS